MTQKSKRFSVMEVATVSPWFKANEIVVAKFTNLDGASVELAGIVTSIRHDGMSPPTYDFTYVTKWRCGSTSGGITIGGMCLWRYLADRDPTPAEIAALVAVSEHPSCVSYRNTDGEYIKAGPESPAIPA